MLQSYQLMIEQLVKICRLATHKLTNKQTNNNDLFEKDGGTKNGIYKD